MDRIIPQSTYCGITLVLPFPSRFDKQNDTLLSGEAGSVVERSLRPDYSTINCDIRVANTIDKSLGKNTKVIILCGERSLKLWGGISYANYSLNQIRGYTIHSPIFENIPCIATYTPQDSVDLFDWESIKNSEAKKEKADKKEDDDEGAGKDYSRTKRSNYRFWLECDIKKAVAIARGEAFSDIFQFSPIKDISCSEILLALKEYYGPVFLDIETSIEQNNGILCVGIGVAIGNKIVVYSILVTDYQFKCVLSPREKLAFLQLMSHIFAKNEVVIHNAMFDLLVLCAGYNLTPPKYIYDTMIAHSRIYPDTEKSLGHCMSLYTWQKYHKDEGHFNPENTFQQNKLLDYNLKDVYGMALVYFKQQQYHESASSIQQANKSIRPFLINTIKGLCVNLQAKDTVVSLNERKLTQLNRIAKALTTLDFNAGSNQQCVEYFHELLDYPVVKRSEETNKPSMDVDVLYALKLKHSENIMLDVVLKYRTIAKETSMLKFELWNSQSLVQKNYQK